ncbi:MAG: hypothetical protein R3B09_06950 [Nannocystaceae bacterium]
MARAIPRPLLTALLVLGFLAVPWVAVAAGPNLEVTAGAGCRVGDGGGAPLLALLAGLLCARALGRRRPRRIRGVEAPTIDR